MTLGQKMRMAIIRTLRSGWQWWGWWDGGDYHYSLRNAVNYAIIIASFWNLELRGRIVDIIIENRRKGDRKGKRKSFESDKTVPNMSNRDLAPGSEAERPR